MCEKCQRRQCDKSASPSGRRQKLWEIEADLHCSVIGTCLSHAALMKIGRLAGLIAKSNVSEYQIHRYFVENASTPNRLARLMQKELDAAYQNAVRAGKTIHCETDLRKFWSESKAKGDIPGPYWALMSHPYRTPRLSHDAFGDVHMLSHVQGISHIPEQRRFENLEKALKKSERALKAVTDKQRQTSRAQRQEIDRLTQKLTAAKNLHLGFAEAKRRLAQFESAAAYRTLQRRIEELEAAQAVAERDHDRLLKQCFKLEQEVNRTRKAYADAVLAFKSARGPTAAADIDGSPIGTELDLSGRRVAYVGGRANAMVHFRSLIESMNGSFCHHDGGIEDNLGRLDGILSQADIVFCPVDCVSHGACLKAKALCKQSKKTFVPLRSASLSSLLQGLHQTADSSAAAT